MPSARRQERVSPPEEVHVERLEEIEPEEESPKIELTRREIKSQKEQNINELNEAVMASPEDAAKLITSFIRD